MDIVLLKGSNKGVRSDGGEREGRDLDTRPGEMVDAEAHPGHSAGRGVS